MGLDISTPTSDYEQLVEHVGCDVQVVGLVRAKMFFALTIIFVLFPQATYIATLLLSLVGINLYEGMHLHTV